MKKLNHLKDIYHQYDCFLIDLWGVIHNGVRLNQSAMNVVENLTNKKKRLIFLSNAPRPNKSVIKFLQKLKMKNEYTQYVLTSGEAALISLKKNVFGEKFFHLGPARDKSLFSGFTENETSIEKSDFIICTGLYDEHENDLGYYENLLKSYIDKKLICTNPDLIVHRGNKEEYCAGTLAKIFEKLGGKVIYFGKPHKEIYDLCLKNNEKTLIIGDNLNTDIKGANNLKFDSIFITSGIHRREFEDKNNMQKLLEKYNVSSKYFQEELSW